MKLFRSKKAIAVAATAALVVGIAGGAYAYYTTTGSGSGTTTAGSAAALTLHQATNTSYVGQVDNSTLVVGNTLGPGDHAVVTFTVDNPSSGNQFLGTISVTSVTSNVAGCDSATQPTWFDLTGTDVVNQSFPSGNAQPVPGSLIVRFLDNGVQNVCSGAILTFHYASN